MPIVDRYRGPNRMKDQSGWGGGLGSLPLPEIQPAGMPSVTGQLAGLGQLEEEKPWYVAASDTAAEWVKALTPLVEQGVELYEVIEGDGETTPVRTTTVSYSKPAAIGGTTLLLIGGAALLLMTQGKRGRRR